MTIKAEQEALFNEWRKVRPDFIADGLVCEESYSDSNRKILFVLKEVNSPNDGDWDLVEDQLKGGGKGSTWSNIARWTDGILNLEQDVNWEHYSKYSSEEKSKSDRAGILKYACHMNLKKSPGGGTSDSEVLETVAKEDKQFILDQISIYKPDVIIACGVGYLLRRVYGLPKSCWQTTTRGFEYFRTPENVPVFASFHPNARLSAAMLHYALMDAVREVVLTSS